MENIQEQQSQVQESMGGMPDMTFLNGDLAVAEPLNGPQFYTETRPMRPYLPEGIQAYRFEDVWRLYVVDEVQRRPVFV